MEIATEESWVNDYDALVRRTEDVETLLVLADEEDDADLAAEIESECERLVEDLERLEFRNMLSGPGDHRNAILSIHSGAGGTDSKEWSDMLLRMYTRWAENEGFKVEMLEHREREVAGRTDASPYSE